MPKAYWTSVYRAIHDPEAMAAYAKLAGPAIQKAGGRFLARGMPAQVYESGVNQRVVIVEFASLYQEALRALGKAVDRDLRITEGVE